MLYQNNVKEKKVDKDLINQYDTIPEDSHVLHLWQPLKFKVDKNFIFIHSNILFKIVSKIIVFIAYPILLILNKLILNFKIYDFCNLRDVKGGKITVSNHVHFLDCTMIGIANFPYTTYFTSLESNFKIPIVKQLITILNTLPIPTDKKYTLDFRNSINQLLKNGSTVHFYPESSLWPYCTRIRNFKNGAFHFAVENNVPIVPCVYVFSEVTGWRSIFRKKPFINMKILTPTYPDLSLSKADAINLLKEDVRQKMISAIKKSS